MADNWYYVLKGNRHGPVEPEFILNMISSQELVPDDFVWKRGFDTWKKIKDTPELKDSEPEKPVRTPTAADSSAPKSLKKFSLKDIPADERSLFIRIGNDRGGESADYGPFSLNQLKELFKENRINGKSFIFGSGLNEWKVLADLPEYQDVFEELPPIIKDDDRRTGTRKPIVARLFIQNNKKLFEGICRDISIGGMQVLLDDFNGRAGDKISINVHPENSDYHFVAAGVIVRTLEGNSGFSFRFQELNEEAKRAIEKYVQEN